MRAGGVIAEELERCNQMAHGYGVGAGLLLTVERRLQLRAASHALAWGSELFNAGAEEAPSARQHAFDPADIGLPEASPPPSDDVAALKLESGRLAVQLRDQGLAAARQANELAAARAESTKKEEGEAFAREGWERVERKLSGLRRSLADSLGSRTLLEVEKLKADVANAEALRQRVAVLEAEVVDAAQARVSLRGRILELERAAARRVAAPEGHQEHPQAARGDRGRGAGCALCPTGARPELRGHHDDHSERSRHLPAMPRSASRQAMTPTRTAVCLAALGLQGRPYIFGGQLYKGDPGTDCSGLVGDAFYLAGVRQMGGDLGAYWTAHRFATECPRVEIPEPGDLWCYLGAGGRYGHVTFCLGSMAFIGLAEPTPRLILNASGGAPDVTTVEIARQRRARIVLLEEAEYHKRRQPSFAVSLAQFYAE